jgi:hypothetical protein
MNKIVKKKWLKALRSGEYKQGGGRLRSGNKYCCLGVLCDLTPEVKWVTNIVDASARYLVESGTQQVFGFLPVDLREKLGISPDEQKELSLLNDNGYTFEEIANVIEEHL